MPAESFSQSVGFAMVPHWVTDLVGDELTVHDLAVYVVLAKRADGNTRNSRPGMRRIAADLGISASTVAQAVERLEDLGCIEVHRDTEPGGRRVTNHYHLPAARVYQQPVQGVPPAGTGVYQQPVQGVPPAVTEQEPTTRTREQEPEFAAAPPATTWWASAFVAPVGVTIVAPADERGSIVDEAWEPTGTPHVWRRTDAAPDDYPARRDLLWEAVDVEFEPTTNAAAKGRRARAVKLMRESGVDPSEIGTLHRVYRIKGDGKWADSDIALASRVDDLRRWAIELERGSGAGAARQLERERLRQAMRRAAEPANGADGFAPSCHLCGRAGGTHRFDCTEVTA